MTVLLRSSTHAPTASEIRLRAASSSTPPLLTLAQALLAEQARQGRELDEATFAVLVRARCSEAPTPLHRDAMLALALAGTPDPELVGAMLGCAPPITAELLRWMRTLALVDPRDGALLAPARKVLLHVLATEHAATLDELRRRAAAELLARATTSCAADAMTALGDAVALHRPGAPRSTFTRIVDEDLPLVEALVRGVDGAVVATFFRIACELDPSAVIVRRFGERIVGVTFGVRVGDAPSALVEADATLAAAARVRARAEGDLADAILIRSSRIDAAAADDDVFAYAPYYVAASAAPDVRWLIAASDDPSSLGIDLRAAVGRASAWETAGQLARVHYERLVPAGSGATHRPAPWTEPTLRAALADLRRPHRLATSELARAVGGVPALRATIEHACDALAREPGYVESARVLRATYFGPVQKQHAIAADLGLPFGTYRHHLRRAIAELLAELTTGAAPAPPASRA
jgi:hypothetical protein